MKKDSTSRFEAFFAGLNPVHIQGMAIVLCSLITFSAFYYFYHSATTPTDENIFIPAPSELYVTTPIPTIVDSSVIQSSIPDEIPAGVFIVDINGERLNTFGQLQTVLGSFDPKDTLEIVTFLPEDSRRKSFFALREQLQASNIIELKSVVRVVSVTKGGSSDRAGIQRGDLIIQIDNESFESANEADRILKTLPAGSTLIYDVLRQGEVLRLDVELSQFGVPFSMVLVGVLGFFTLGFGVYLTCSVPNSLAGQSIGWMLIFLSSAILLAPSFSFSNAPLFNLHRTGSFIGALIFFTLFTISWIFFPKNRADLKPFRLGVPVAYLILGLFGYLAYSNLSFGLALASMNVSSIALPLFWYRTGILDKEYQKIAKNILLFAIPIFIIILLQTIFATFILSFYALNFITSICFSALAFVYLYNIGRFSLFDLDIRIRRSIQYWLVRITWSVLLFVMGLALLIWFSTWDIPFPDFHIVGNAIEFGAGSGNNTSLNRLAISILGIGAFLALLRTFRLGDLWINRRYYQRSYDYRQVNSQVHQLVTNNITITDLSYRFSLLLNETMLLEQSALILKNSGTGVLKSYVIEIDKPFTWQSEDALLQHIFSTMEKSQNEIRIEQFDLPVRKSLQNSGFELAFPLFSRKRMFGVILLGSKLAETTFDQEDVAFLNMINHQVSVAYENAFLYEQLTEQERLKQELRLARHIQLNSLPQKTPQVHGLQVVGASNPAYEVGGDYFDYLQHEPDELTVVVGDVSGKGTSAALYLSKVQGIMRTLYEFRLSPAELFVKTNALLRKEMERKSFVTVLGAQFDMKKKTVTIARAGHLPLYKYSPESKEIISLTPHGMGLGMADTSLFKRHLQQETLTLHSGEVYVLASDGVTELKVPGGEEFEEHRFCHAIQKHAHLSADEILEHLQSELKAFCPVQNDDQTIVVVKIE